MLRIPVEFLLWFYNLCTKTPFARQFSIYWAYLSLILLNTWPRGKCESLWPVFLKPAIMKFLPAI